MRVSLISPYKLETFIKSLKGEIFTVKFVKKDGTERVMNCRRGVSKGVKGTGNPLSIKTSVLRVFDMKKGAFRTINLKTVEWIKAGGVQFLVVS